MLSPAALALCVALSGQGVQPRPPIRHDVVVDGHHLAVWEKRPAQPRAAMLLVHGRTWSSLPNFDLQVAGERRSMMDLLNDAGLDTYAVDLRGYGATPRDATGWLTPDRAVADVRAVVDWIRASPANGRRPVYVLGFSRGSLIAAYLAQQVPEKIAGVILLGFGLDVDGRIAPSDAPATAPRRKNTVDGAMSDFITPEAATRGTVDAFVRAALRADPIYAEWRDEQQFNGFAPSKVLVPTLLVHGDLDPSTPMLLEAKLFTRLGTADKAWVVFPGADHVVHLEKALPDLVRAIVWFVRRHDTTTPSTEVP
ncbi:MAG TPA: alpha/beta fold hydrolase [Vicinamibacterales bacterium]